KVLYGSALLLWRQRDATLAAARAQEAVAIFRTVGGGRWQAYGLALLARVRLTQARLAEAGPLLAEARSAWDTAAAADEGFDNYLRYYLGGLSTLLSSPALLRGDAERARARLADSLPDLEAAGDHQGRGIVLGMLGLAAAQRGEHPEARARY